MFSLSRSIQPRRRRICHSSQCNDHCTVVTVPRLTDHSLLTYLLTANPRGRHVALSQITGRPVHSRTLLHRRHVLEPRLASREHKFHNCGLCLGAAIRSRAFNITSVILGSSSSIGHPSSCPSSVVILIRETSPEHKRSHPHIHTASA